jgi:hypothetical protein
VKLITLTPLIRRDPFPASGESELFGRGCLEVILAYRTRGAAYRYACETTRHVIPRTSPSATRGDDAVCLQGCRVHTAWESSVEVGLREASSTCGPASRFTSNSSRVFPQYRLGWGRKVGSESTSVRLALAWPNAHTGHIRPQRCDRSTPHGCSKAYLDS